MKNIRFVQFPHPGGEHRPGPDGTGKEWNWLRNPNGSDNPHRRTFLQVKGTRLTEKGPVDDDLWAWAEWEAEAKVVRELNGSGREPTTVFEPYWLPKDSFENLHNTDPFIFGGFYYTDCKQGTSPSLTGMLTLDVGSVIVFGSGFNDGWVLDTVIVVRDHVDHNVKNYEERLSNRIPDGYKEVVLGPTYSEHAIRRKLPRRLYIGATYDDPLCGMFSFFPCAARGTGFARPMINLSKILTQDRFNPNLRQGMKGHGVGTNPLTLDQITKLWADIRDQVKASGCDLGVRAAMPQPLRNAD